MKIVTAENGKQTVKISKSDWESIGTKAGWLKEAKWGGDVEVKHTGEHAKKSIAQLKKEITNLKKKQEAYKKKHGKANKKTTGEIKEREFAIRAKKRKDKWGKTK